MVAEDRELRAFSLSDLRRFGAVCGDIALSEARSARTSSDTSSIACRSMLQ